MSGSREQPAIVIKDLVKHYSRKTQPAIDSLSLEVERGTIFGLLGPNGAGKTTLISILCTLLRPSGGQVSLLGRDIRREAAAVRRLIGLVPQEIALYPSLTARENLNFFAQVQRVPNKEIRTRVDFCLEMVGLEEHGDHRILDYSGGMKRRINLAVGILHEPKILFLDEPTVGIDPQSRALIFDRISQLNEVGMTIVYTTHYMEEAQQLCDKIAIMDMGRVVALDTPSGLIESVDSCMNLEELFLSLTGKQLRD